MKKVLFYLISMLFVATSCVDNEEYEDIETIEAETEEEAAEKAEEILPIDAVIDEIRVA